MELCLLILGESQIDQSIYQFRQAGAYHMSRWMAKVIYSFKIYLFRDHFHLTSTEHRHLTEFCSFASHGYVNSWITCPVTCDAPVTCNCLKISNIIQLSKLVLLQPWQSLKTTFGMLDLNWCHFLCFPAVCQRTWKATLSTVCVKHMIKKYSGMSEVWKQTSHVIYPQHSWVTLLTVHPYLPSILLVLTMTSSCHEIHEVHTHRVHQLRFSRLSQLFVHWLWSVMQLNVQLPWCHSSTSQI